MTRQEGNKGVARDLTANPNFVVMEANSPPQGLKRSGGNKTTSTKKKNKPTPKEKTPPTKRFWLGFEVMEKLAIDGALKSFVPTPIHTLIMLVFSYPHVGQSFFPIRCSNGIGNTSI